MDSGSPYGSQAPTPLSREFLSDIIGSIYDCVLDPMQWAGVLETICAELSFAVAIFGVLRPLTGLSLCQASARLTPEALTAASAMTAQVTALWGGVERMLEYAIGEPVVLSQAVGREAIASNEYYLTWGRPRGLHDQVAFMVTREPDLIANVGFGRHEAAGEIGEREVDTLRLLAPHFRRAVTISNLFDMKAIETATLGAALDTLTFGIVLVDRDLSVLHANRAAQEMLRQGDPIQMRQGVLHFAAGAPSRAAIERAIHELGQGETGIGGRGIGIPIRGNGEPFVAHVLPLQGQSRRGVFPRAAAALFIAPATAPRRTPTDALSLIYDLTPAEARVFERLAAGNSQRDIAASLGIAPSTVKTHALHVFEKTGCRRQTDVVRLAARLSLPI